MLFQQLLMWDEGLSTNLVIYLKRDSRPDPEVHKTVSGGLWVVGDDKRCKKRFFKVVSKTKIIGARDIR